MTRTIPSGPGVPPAPFPPVDAPDVGKSHQTSRVDWSMPPPGNSSRHRLACASQAPAPRGSTDRRRLSENETSPLADPSVSVSLSDRRDPVRARRHRPIRLRAVWAAQVVQRNWRGHASRQWFELLRRQQAACGHVQRVWRGAIDRRRVKDTRRNRELAAACVQVRGLGTKGGHPERQGRWSRASNPSRSSHPLPGTRAGFCVLREQKRGAPRLSTTPSARPTSPKLKRSAAPPSRGPRPSGGE